MTKARVSQEGISRPPIVTVLGHVDHGKTTLLDTVRMTEVAKKEAGGITQEIGASVVKTKEGKKITFIDTPGHAAFAQMRSRGAAVADIALLVVAVDDGVKPQTKESLAFIREAKIPFIVAVSKIDLPQASTERVRAQLEKEKVLFEGRGGDVPLVALSAKTGKGIPEMLEMIILVSEVHEIKGDPEGVLEAVVIETGKDARGPLVSLVLRNGSLNTGDEIVADGVGARVRGLFDDKGKPVKKVEPGEPALILGFSKLPPIGSKIEHLTDKSLPKEQETKKSAPTLEKSRRPGGASGPEGKIPIVVKAQSSGALEDLLASLPEKIVVISSSVGNVNESDVFLAKSSDQARVFAFGSKVSANVEKLAETEGVEIKKFDVIYELLGELEELVEEGQRQILGKAEILATFPHDDKKIAGCKVISGRISKNDSLILTRKEEDLGEAKAASMKMGKKDSSLAKLGEEFGLILEPQLDFKLGDVLVSVRK